jgi:hypothetical protein
MLLPGGPSARPWQVYCCNEDACPAQHVSAGETGQGQDIASWAAAQRQAMMVTQSLGITWELQFEQFTILMSHTAPGMRHVTTATLVQHYLQTSCIGSYAITPRAALRIRRVVTLAALYVNSNAAWTESACCPLSHAACRDLVFCATHRHHSS